ncbi:MAG TPA: 3-deoxy-8-phosphooctulonate synthase [Candidatus Polarisedimenticolia bacterium]|nr:3-deoxy-8-phosphooctulonate synthase [Candidatus Polarisedimenticolia bacterium]
MPASGSGRPSAEPGPGRTRRIEINPDLAIGGGAPLAFIGGPCVIESEEHALRLAKALLEITRRVGIPYIFKSSFDKANRSSGASFRGPGLREGLRILKLVKSEVGVPVLSDIHEPEQAEVAAQVIDILQIPAFLCRQTDLLTAAGRTGRPVNIKKGQFLAPWDIGLGIEKVRAAGNDRVLVTERGTTFGYQNLVVDFRSLVVMRGFGFPVVMDATHAVQLPGGQGDRSGGEPLYIPHLARAAAAVGIDALFCEVHDDPAAAKSDGANALPLASVEPLLSAVRAIDALVREG